MNKEQMIKQAEALWAKIHKASKKDERFNVALAQLESTISELYKIAPVKE